MKQLSHQQQTIRAGLVAEAETILDAADQENRALSADETARYDAAIARVEAINASQSDGQRPTFRSQPSGIVPNDDGDYEARRTAVPSFPGKLRAFANTRAGREQAHLAGRWFAAALTKHEPSLNYCRANGIRSALSEGVNTAGGALVPEEMSSRIIELVEEYGAFRANAFVQPMSSDSMTIPRRVGGLTAYYVGENTAGTESDASWDNVNLTARKLMVLSRMSSEVNEDAIVSLGDKMTAEIALAFAIKEDSVGFSGTGVGADGGITGVLVKALQASFSKAKVTAAANHDTFAELDADDLSALTAAVPGYAKRGAKWYCSPSALELVFNAIRMSAGGNSAENLTNSLTPTFGGYPIVVTPVFPDDPTADLTGAVMIAFGNLAQAATLGSRREMRVALSGERWFELDQIGIRGTCRHDINVHDLGWTVVKSPFAVLVGGA